MEKFSDLREKIGHVDRPHTIDDIKEIRASKGVWAFLRDCKDYRDEYDNHIYPKYPDLKGEFNVDKVSVGDLCQAFDQMVEYYDSLSDYQSIFRLVKDYEGSDKIDETNIGHCWSRSMRGLRSYIHNQNSYGGKETSRLAHSDRKIWKLFVGETHKDNVDWVAEAFLSIWGWTDASNEHELRIWDISKVKVLKIVDLSSAEVDGMLHSDSMVVDLSDIEFTGDSPSGETQPFSWFKNLRNSNRDIVHAYGDLFLKKEADEKWCDDTLGDFLDEYYDEHFGEQGGEAYIEWLNSSMAVYLLRRTSPTKEGKKQAEDIYDSLISLGDSMPKEKADSINWQETTMNYLFGKNEIVYKKN